MKFFFTLLIINLFLALSACSSDSDDSPSPSVEVVSCVQSGTDGSVIGCQQYSNSDPNLEANCDYIGSFKTEACPEGGTECSNGQAIGLSTIDVEGVTSILYTYDTLNHPCVGN